jgi:fructose-1,6-bisphosphatase/inositol monophosphatase family enzyme
VTATDVAVEDAVRTMVGGAVGSLVVGEERGGEPPADGAPYWVVDPICGTRNFASGVPLYSINLALVEGGLSRSAGREPPGVVARSPYLAKMERPLPQRGPSATLARRASLGGFPVRRGSL